MDQTKRDEAIAAIAGASLTYLEFEDTDDSCAFERFSSDPWFLTYDEGEAPNPWSIEGDGGQELVFAATAAEAFAKLDEWEMRE